MNLGHLIHQGATGLTRRAAGLSTHTQDVNGLSVAYDRRDGTGVPILMLHGFSADREVWARFAAALKGRMVIIPDQIGHGDTPFDPDADYSAPAQARRILDFADALQIDRFHVVGNSMGGFVAAHLAALAPRRTLSAALICPAGISSPEPSPLDRMKVDGHDPFLMDDPAQFDAFYAMTMHRPPFVPGLVRRSIAAGYVARRAQLATIHAGFYHRDLLDDGLSAIISPTWVAWGRHDQLIDVSSAQRWADGLPDAKLTVYEDLGHMPMLEAPRQTAHDYLAFLDEVEGDPS